MCIFTTAYFCFQIFRHPYCYDATADTWNNDSNVVLDVYDELNSKDLTHGIPKPIDRHDCTSLDANNDGIPDIICSVGADKRQVSKRARQVTGVCAGYVT